MDADLLQTGLAEELQHRFALVMVVLQEQPATRSERAKGPAHHCPNGHQTILSAIKSQAGLVVANQRIEARQESGGNVGRVGYRQIYLPPPGP